MGADGSEQLTGFFAYPSQPAEVASTIRQALGPQRSVPSLTRIQSWEQNDIAGRFLVDPVLDEIAKRPLFFADITSLNFNVAYEVGYAIARRRRVVLVRNSAVKSDSITLDEVGIFDTIGWTGYSNASELYKIIAGTIDPSPLPFDDSAIKVSAPLFVVTPRIRTDSEIRIFARIRRARLQYRVYDPEEQGRLSGRDAITGVAESHGVVIPLLPESHNEATIHNLRAAFVAGLATGMDKELLLLQPGDDPVPLDYRDLVYSYKHLGQIDDAIAELAPLVTARLQPSSIRQPAYDPTLLASVTLGATAAENEVGELGSYYLETDEYQRTLRGEVQVVAGRKGAGKTALFVQVRNRKRRHKNLVVLDLKPEGYQLLKFREQVLDLLSEGTREHTITAFWEYLLMLEICNKLLRDDRVTHKHNHKLFGPYQTLHETYAEDRFVKEGDFAERMASLTQRITSSFAEKFGDGPDHRTLSANQITGLLYSHDIQKLQATLFSYLEQKEGLWILFDNVDKGWPPHGISSGDLLTLRCLLEAMANLRRNLGRASIPFNGLVFIRNDVYDHLVDVTPDRGKVSSVSIDWSDPDLLRELIRRRITSSGVLPSDATFAEAWGALVVSHINGEETSQYLIERSLMRPRLLIKLIQACRSHAVNLGHRKIEVSDIEEGEEGYSTSLVLDIGFEIRDVLPQAAEVLYAFIEANEVMSAGDVNQRIENILVDRDRVINMLLWYGFLGVAREDKEAAYIHTVKYDMKRLRALAARTGQETIYHINPAFWKGLEIRGKGTGN